MLRAQSPDSFLFHPCLAGDAAIRTRHGSFHYRFLPLPTARLRQARVHDERSQ